MKKILSLILILAVLFTAAWAEPVGGILFETGWYTLTLPGNWKIDLDDISESETGSFEDLGFMYAMEDDGLAIEASKEYYESLEGISLWDVTDEDFRAYMDMLLEEFADDGAFAYDPVYAGEIPFVLIHREDEEGEFYYAETVADGYVLSFYAYALDWDSNYLPLQAKHLETFREILGSFQPNASQE